MKKLLVILLVLFMVFALTFAMAEVVDPVPVFPGIDLTPLFQAVIAFLAALITYKVVPWFNARTTIQQQGKMRAAVKVAVFAAEQLFDAGRGHDKLLYVKGKLAEKGFKIEIDEIEAAVYALSLNQNWATTEEPPEPEDEAIGLTE